MFWKNYSIFLRTIWLLPVIVTAQNTTGSLGGRIKTAMGEPLAGVTVRAVHEPTGTLFFSQTNRAGIFHIDNLQPGGPYAMEVSFEGYRKEKKSDIYVNLGEMMQVDVSLTVQFTDLANVTVETKIFPGTQAGKNSIGIVLDKDKINFLPSVGRNLHDYLAVIPQATLIGSNEGAISFAGQNNRYNSFYVDGAVNNDVFGLAASGTNGGQAGISPLSIDAIEQFQVALSPYDASLGNFTGAAINALTRSGTNRAESSVYYFFSNQNLAGKPASQSQQEEAPAAEMYRKIYGIRLQGAITKNKIFYFINTELQRDLLPQLFSFNAYRGNTKNLNTLSILANSLRSNYRYEPGSFLNNPESVNADRVATRFDWNISNRHKLSVSGRYIYGQRIHTYASNPNTIHFSNNGFALFSTTWAGAVEWKTIIGKHTAHKLALTYTGVQDDRAPAGKAFPRVRINDGDGAFIFGTDNSSTINLLVQHNWTITDKLNFSTGKHAWSLGMSGEYIRVFNTFIQNSFGSYTYASPGDFFTNAHPSAYQLGFSLLDTLNNDHTAAAAKFVMAKISVFVNDEIRISGNCLLNYGIRMDQYHFPTKPVSNDYVNDVAIPAFTRYWDVAVNPSGVAPKIKACFSPRFGFLYKIPTHNLTLRGGMGIFSGRIPLAWPGGVYNYNGVSVGGYTANLSQLNHIRFRSDPYQQWRPAEIGAVINKEPLNLITDRFSMPSVFRSTLAIEKKLRNGWTIMLEAMFTKNLAEIYYTNINLLPPTDHAVGADNRLVYSAVNNARVPLNPDGSNPYDYAILLGNNRQPTGQAYNITATLQKRAPGKITIELTYHFGNSLVVHEGAGSVNASQWRFMETVNGRNFITESTSDFSAGHRILAWINRKFSYHHKKLATGISISYTGQSGSPFSYVYGYSSITRDDGRYSAYDLVYIPTAADLAGMVFLPNTVNGILYTPLQQKDAFENYIGQHTYLRTHRGRYAARNGSHTPFTHRVDLKLTQDIRIRIGNTRCLVQLTCDLFNVGNFLNENWGNRYTQPNDNFELVDFAGFVSSTDLTPQYRFNPMLLLSDSWKISTATAPAYSSRWVCQFGIRFTF